MKFIIALLLGVTLTGCQNLWSGKNRSNADMLQLYTVDRTPTHPDQQTPDHTYVLDFAILDPVSLSPEEAAALYTAMENDANFSAENQKRCPFVGQYAVEVAGEFVAVISSTPCSKVQRRSEGETTTRHLELTKNNGLELIFAGIVQK